MSLEIKKQNPKNDQSFLRINLANNFRATSLEAGMHQVRSGLEVLQRQQSSLFMILRQNTSRKLWDTILQVAKTLSKVESMYLQVKLKEVKFNWCV